MTEIKFKDVFDNSVKVIITAGVISIATNVWQTKLEYAAHKAEATEKFSQIHADREADNKSFEETTLALLELIKANKESIGDNHTSIEDLNKNYIQTKAWLEAILPKNDYNIPNKRNK